MYTLKFCVFVLLFIARNLTKKSTQIKNIEIFNCNIHNYIYWIVLIDLCIFFISEEPTRRISGSVPPEQVKRPGILKKPRDSPERSTISQQSSTTAVSSATINLRRGELNYKQVICSNTWYKLTRECHTL